jgi:heavy metal sensor kinase
MLALTATRRNRISISLRLALWFGAIFLAGWVAFGAVMWTNLKLTLTHERHTTLDRRVDRLENLLRKTGQNDSSAQIAAFTDFAHATGNGLAEIFRADGTRALPSPSTAAQSFPWPTVSSLLTNHAAESFQQVTANDEPYWVLMRPYQLGNEKVILMAAAPSASNQLILSRFWMGLLASAPVLLLISCAGGYWLSRRALRPVDRITAMAQSISIGNLSERLPVSRTGDELERLAETCNAMLTRLESSVERIKQFTGDASHELRGPLSFVRTVSEVALRNPEADKASREAFAEIVTETTKASALLEEMLVLARADSDEGDAVLVPLNLIDVVEDVCERSQAIAAERGLTLSVMQDAAHPIAILGDFSMLRRLLWILLDNALKFTEAPGQIEVALSSTSSDTTILVRDSGVGIAEEALSHIFDRFYRADPSRSQIEGAGLGLAIAKWIADLHHAELSVTSRLTRGTIVQLTLPLCTAPAAARLTRQA